MRLTIAVALAVVVVVPCRAQSSNASTGITPAVATQVTVNVTIALVDNEMQIRPVPLHALLITSAGRDTVRVRTGADGKVSARVASGTYTVSSVAPVVFQGHEYRWRMPVGPMHGTSIELSLTNDNALTAEVAVDPPTPSRTDRLDPAAAMFTRFGPSVFRVIAGLAHGSGFLADTLGGVIITNAHVVEAADSGTVSVAIDSVTRVHAELLARDPSVDIAILRVNPDVLKGVTPLRLERVVGRAPVVAGERLVAMGYPLNQELTITSGIASSVRAGAIISDVNINHGNSGGPLFNADGEVVAINTFGDLPNNGGAGISGSILVGRAGPALARAAAELTNSRPPSSAHLPVMPAERLDVSTLKASAEMANPTQYRDFAGIHLAGFELSVQTPLQTFVAMKTYENAIAGDRKKREALAGLSETDRYSELRDVRDWNEYVGGPTTPVVSLAIVPKVGETGGSLFGRIMLGPNMKATYKFQGDVRGMRLFRNEEPVDPIKGGHMPVKAFVDNRWVSLKDVADEGFYVFDAEVLRPGDDGSPPSIVVAVRDLKNPDKLKCLELPIDVLAQAWNDFEEFYKSQRPAAGFRRANARAAKDRKWAWQSGFLKKDCSWS